MPLYLECVCGFNVTVADESAERPKSCPECGGVLLIGNSPPLSKKAGSDEDGTPYGLSSGTKPANTYAPSRPRWTEDDEQVPVAYGLSNSGRMLAGAEGSMGRIRVSADPMPIRSLAIADKEPIALAAAENRIVVLDLMEKKKRGTLKGHRARVTCGAITPDGMTAITGDRDGEILVWDVDRCEEIAGFRIHDDKVNSVAISPDGRFAVSGSLDNNVRLWRVKNGKTLELRKSRWMSAPKAVAFSPDGKHLLAAGDKLMLWDFETGDVVHRLDAPPGGFGNVTFTEDGTKMAACGAQEARVFRWERDKATPDLMLAVPPSQDRQIFSATLAAGAQHIVTVSSVVTASAVHGRGLSTGETVVAVLAFGIVGAVVISAATEAATARGPERTIAVETWRIGSKERGSFIPISLPPDGRMSLLASSNQRRAILGTADGFVQVFGFL